MGNRAENDLLQAACPQKGRVFYGGNAPSANGLKRDDLLTLPDEAFESNHGFIQWAWKWKNSGDHAALSCPGESLPSSTAALTTATRCAPLGDHLMRCFFPMRTLAISFTRPSALDVETAFPC